MKERKEQKKSLMCRRYEEGEKKISNINLVLKRRQRPLLVYKLFMTGMKKEHRYFIKTEN